MAPTVSSKPTTFRLPDLISHCPFPAAYHKNGDAIAATSEKWVEDSCRVFNADLLRHLHASWSGQLASYCYNDCEDHRFRIICDFMNVLFLLDDFSDELVTNDTEILADLVMNAMAFPQSYRPTHTKGKVQPEAEPDASSLTRDYWLRCIPEAGPYVQARCAENVELYLVAVHQQARYRDNGGVPSLEEYIHLRRLSSGCKPLFDLMEYSLDIELPEFVIESSIIKKMQDNVNDFVAFTNDIFSYNVEQSRGDDHNLVAILMKNYNLDLQTAVDRAGEMCLTAMREYIENKARLPSWGPKIDGELASYLRGLESWLSGSLQWSFLTPRYFGNQRQEVKKHGWVKLITRSRVSANAS